MVTALCLYRVKAGSEADFRALLAKHWPTLRRVGLAADEPSVIYEGLEKSGEPLFAELLQWKDPDSSRHAHEIPEVMAVWEPMGMLCEARGGKPSMEFPHVRRIEIDFQS